MTTDVPTPARRTFEWRLAAIVIIAAALMSVRLTAAGFDIDEYFELLARKCITETGLPVLPSGAVNAYGGLLLWPGALFTWIGGLDVFANRLPNTLLGLASVWVVGRTARRLLGDNAGLAAAAAMALNPGLIVWSANVKVYGAMTLFTACAVDRWAAWVIEKKDEASTAFAAWFAAAALCHPAAAFVGAGLGVAGVVVRGPKWLFRPRTIVTWGACGAALVAFYLVIRRYDPTMLEHLAGESRETTPWRRFVALVYHVGRSLASHGWRSTWHAVPFWLALLTIATALAALRRGLTAEFRSSRAARGTAFAAAWFVSFLAFVCISVHQGAQYLLPAYPLLAIAAGCSVALLLERLTIPALALAACIALVAAQGVMSRDSIGEVFDRRADFGRVVGHFAEARPGDVSFGAGPAAGLHSKGVLPDYIVYAGDSSLIAMQKDGRWVDRYLGRPMLGTVDEVRPVFEEAKRAWFFVTDKDRELKRVTPELDAWLTSRMRVIDSAPGCSLYRSGD